MPSTSESHAAGPGAALHVVFGMSHAGYLRNFEAAIGALLSRGHRVTVVTERVAKETRPILARLERQGAFDLRTVAGIAEPPDPEGVRLRAALDYWYYLDPRFSGTPGLRKRAREAAPAFAVRYEGAPPWVRRGLAAAVRWRERRRPVPEPLLAFLRDLRPDVVLLTPLIYLESSQVLWIRAARALGVPSLFCVHSWDNLTTKGTLHDEPDRVVVWNEAQRREAQALHGVQPGRCLVSGAPAFDHWFSTAPAVPRTAFLEALGLPADGAVILYLCSSRFIAKGETTWIAEWLRALRASDDPRVRSAAVIVRPHPAAVVPPREWRLDDPAACVYPLETENPVSDDARMRYYHSLAHCDAVVGLNTTAMIEAAILDRPVFSIRQPGTAQVRETLHFDHLVGGLVTVAPDLAAHVADLGRALADPPSPARARAFMETFVRPMGRDRAAGVIVAELVESAALDTGKRKHR